MSKPFEFLEQAPIESLVPYLSREHGQTVAVVLSYLAPARAAQVLAALSPRLQAETTERLMVSGETDPSSLEVIAQELSNWLARQQAARPQAAGPTQIVKALLAAADDATRNSILANLSQYNQPLALQLAPIPSVATSQQSTQIAAPRVTDVGIELPTPPPRRPVAAPLRRIQIEDFTRLDRPTLAFVLQSVDVEVLVLALVGASESVVNHIVGHMPRSVAKTFRKRLRALGPIRLRDVQTAQQDVAAIAAKVLAARRTQRPTLT